LLVEQHVEIALELSDAVIVLDRGGIVYDNTRTGEAPDRDAIENLIGVGA
jgi:ABC-type branched-subunit amino acid transport system ATPase component